MLLVGCTELDVKPLASESAEPAKGYSYSLPYARYKISIVRTLKDCSDTTTEIDFDVAVTATSVFEPDPTQTFAIDNASLANWFKTSELSIERYDNQMLKSIGATATDHTGKVIVNSITGLVKLAQTALITATGAPPRAIQFCDEKLLATAKGLKAKRTALGAATAKLDGETKRLKLMGDAVTPFGRGTADRIQSRLFRQSEKVADAQIDVAMKQADLQSDIDALSDVETFTWPPDGRTIAELHERPDKTWLYRFIKKNPQGNPLVSATNTANVNLRLVPLNGLALKEVDGRLPPAATGGTAKGIRYRNPVAGALQISICKSAPALQDGESRDPAVYCAALPRVLVTRNLAEGPVPQFGRLMLIPFENYAFQANAMKATFSADGNLVTASYAETASRAEVASDTFNQVAGALLQAAKDLPTAGANARTAALNAKVAELQAQANLNKAKLALEPTGTEENARQAAIIVSDTSLKEAQLKNLEATQALAKAQASQSSP